MTVQQKWALISASLRRHQKHFLLASIGVVTGIMAFTFFWALSSGVSQVVLGEIFPVQALEVEPKNVGISLGPIEMGLGPDQLSEHNIAAIAAIPHVMNVYPKMKVRTPMVAAGGKKYIGNDLQAELLVDGIDPKLVTKGVAAGYSFQDAGSDQPFKACKRDVDCANRQFCYDAPTLSMRYANPNPGYAYCRSYVPVLVSNHLVELFNSVVRRAHHFPKLNPDYVIGYAWDAVLGASMVGRSVSSKQFYYKFQLVGFSDQAIWLGVTLPLSYVQRFNALYYGEQAKQSYHSLSVMVDRKDHVAEVSQAIERLGFAIQDSGAARASFIILVATLVLTLISLAIVAIAAINIMHVYFMLVYERQQEIGLMRAVGAKKSDIRWVILGEAGFVGFFAGLAGVVLAYGLSVLLDFISHQFVPDFPYKPDSYFEFDLMLMLVGLGLAVGFCMLGAFLPARRAATIDPAQILTGQ